VSAVAWDISENDVVVQGKRAGARQKRGFRPVLLLMALGVTGSVVAWGYLVIAAIDFGGSARKGDTAAWWYLALASLGGVACLFLGLILISRTTRILGITQAPPPRAAQNVPRDTTQDSPHDPDHPTGGHRAPR
jgi:hypothetical protein